MLGGVGNSGGERFRGILCGLLVTDYAGIAFRDAGVSRMSLDDWLTPREE